MRSIRLSILGLALVALGLAGCVSQRQLDEPDADRACVKVRRINSMSALDDRHVLVRVGAADYYLFTIDRGCSGLNFATGMAIEEATTRVCDGASSFIAFVHPALGGRRCRIRSVEPVEDKDAAEALIESRMGAESREEDK